VKGARAFGVLDSGVGIRMMRGMSDGEKIYLVPVLHNDELKKLFVMIVITINDGLLFSSLLPSRVKKQP
jgi:hypothetical protein